MSIELRPYRKALSTGGLDAVQKLPGFFGDMPQVVPEDTGDAGHHFEALAFDALTHGHAGWGCVCMGAALEQFQLAGRRADIERCVQQNLAILEEAFPPFQDQAELLDAMRVWARLQLGVLSSEGQRNIPHPEKAASPFHDAVLARHKWWFSLLRTRHLGHRLECDALLDGLGTNLAERILLWTACVVCENGSGGVRAGIVLDLLGGDAQERDFNLGLLQPGGRLRQSGLLLMIPNTHNPGPLENWWLKPHPEVQGFLLSAKPLGKAWHRMLQPLAHDTEGVLSLWRQTLNEVGLLPPLELEEEADILPGDVRLTQKICELLSVVVWTQGQPGKPLAMDQLRTAIETHQRG